MEQRQKNTLRDYFDFGAVGSYFFRVFRKGDPNHRPNFNLRVMHGINRISILMFLFCLVVMATRCALR
jgi:hypothetical protein